MENRSQAISIIGSGFTGIAVGKGLSLLGYKIIFYDVEYKDLPNFTTNIDQAIDDSSISIICVPTPTLENGDIDLSFLKDAINSIASKLQYKKQYHLIVIKSTVVPMTTESFVIPELEKVSRKRAGTDFGICVNPEFMTECSHSWDKDGIFDKNFFTEDRIVIGEYDQKSGDLLEQIYKPLNLPIWRVDLKTAELIKYAANCMLATKISYWNEIFLICKQMGIDSNLVAAAVADDPRIGKYGIVHGKAFGGKCLPKDLKAFISLAKRYHRPILLEAVDTINEIMKQKYGVRE